IDLIPVIKDTANLFQDENIKIMVAHSVSNAIAEADQVQLRRLLINMVRNSIQADASLINIQIASDAEFYKIVISDNGKGISENNKSKIFEANFTTKEKGMGLGLKLAKRFLEGINGSIKLINTGGDGAEFEITIPKLKAKENAGTGASS
ncbi:MAG TPA: ATP-binding protein, partial [Ignavibacteriaceae bacterium]|nr:ATP-binding protein [Ignavibacteriaceae bacterium]